MIPLSRKSRVFYAGPWASSLGLALAKKPGWRHRLIDPGGTWGARERGSRCPPELSALSRNRQNEAKIANNFSRRRHPPEHPARGKMSASSKSPSGSAPSATTTATPQSALRSPLTMLTMLTVSEGNTLLREVALMASQPVAFPGGPNLTSRPRRRQLPGLGTEWRRCQESRHFIAVEMVTQ